MRHGKPKIDHRLRLSAAEFGVWVEKYNAAGIDMGLMVVARYCGEAVAKSTASHMEYPFPEHNERRR
jgi:hypothetical protein